MLINLDDALAYCEECAKVAEDLEMRCYESAAKGGPDSVFCAIAYFGQRKMMFRHEIPAILKEIAGVNEEGEK